MIIPSNKSLRYDGFEYENPACQYNKAYSPLNCKQNRGIAGKYRGLAIISFPAGIRQRRMPAKLHLVQDTNRRIRPGRPAALAVSRHRRDCPEVRQSQLR